jgi:predicted Zn-dependent peptidase
MGLFLLFFSEITAQTASPSFKTVTKTSPDGKYRYEEVENDPTHTRFYKLQNGLTVILTENHLEPRIMTLITTKAGSKNDPATNTGLAHYLEHMLFKGTDKYGSLDFEKEQVELAKIESLYEKYNITTDTSERKAIYHQIDSVSGEAAKFAIANEYDKMVSGIGAKMSNAFTNFENTTYMENVPSNNLDKFFAIQAERFRNPILRLFHTELEAVYEEKNIGLDNGDNKIFEGMFASLFKKHPYGTQTTIGTIEHLKNPSLKAIREYYYQNYVPNNMAIILAGDLDADKTIASVEKYFGAWKSKEVPKFTFEPEAERTEKEEITVKSPDEESVAVGFKMPNTNSQEAIVCDLVSSILYNGKSGLIDKNLVKSQKVLQASGFNYLLKDYGIMFFQGKPLQGQSLGDVKDMILAQIEKLKKGDFDADLIQATVNNLKVNRVREQENSVNMAFVLNDVFAAEKSWETYLNNSQRMGKITKQDVVAFANKWFGNNYTVVYKLTGEDKNVPKVQKPEIHPVAVNRESQSEFLKSIVNAPSKPLVPVFVDYDKDINKGQLKQDLPILHVPNKINNLFSVYYVLDMGKENDKKLPLAIDYLKLIGTTTKSNEQLNKELYQLAVDFDVYSSDDQVYISLAGLEENFDKALLILEDVIRNPKPDKVALGKMIESKIKEREDALLNKQAIFGQALDYYVKYGKVNPFNDVLSNEQLRNIKAEELTAIIKSLSGFKHKVYYYGARPLSKLTETLAKNHKTPAKLKDYPKATVYPQLQDPSNTLYFVNYDMVQAEIGMTRWGDKFEASKLPLSRAFNEYYGGGMGSVVFQEIRESKALAYSAYSRFRQPNKKEDPFSSVFYVGTQADKVNDAMTAMNELINTMPKSEKLWETSKKAIKADYESRRISKTSILFNYQNAQRLGLTEDSGKNIYNQIDKINLGDIEKFHADQFKDKVWAIKVLGSKDKLNMDVLKKYGKVVELSLKDIFGYEAVKVVKP